MRSPLLLKNCASHKCSVLTITTKKKDVITTDYSYGDYIFEHLPAHKDNTKFDAGVTHDPTW